LSAVSSTQGASLASGFSKLKENIFTKKLKTNFPNDANERFEENISITFVESNSGTPFMVGN